MILVDIPEYARVTPEESGPGFNLDFETYRLLCHTSLAIINGFSEPLMGIYRIGEAGCGLDIWIGDLSFSLLINCQENELSLLACQLDSVNYQTVCVCDNSADSWRELGRQARQHLKSNA